MDLGTFPEIRYMHCAGHPESLGIDEELGTRRQPRAGGTIRGRDRMD